MFWKSHVTNSQIGDFKYLVLRFLLVYDLWGIGIASPGRKSSFKLYICIHKDIDNRILYDFFRHYYSYFILQLPSLSVLTSPNSNYSLPFSHFPLQIPCTLLFPSLLSSLGPFILQCLWLFQVAYSPEHLKLETKIERVHVTFVLLGLDFRTQSDPFQFYPLISKICGFIFLCN